MMSLVQDPYGSCGSLGPFDQRKLISGFPAGQRCLPLLHRGTVYDWDLPVVLTAPCGVI